MKEQDRGNKEKLGSSLWSFVSKPFRRKAQLALSKPKLAPLKNRYEMAEVEEVSEAFTRIQNHFYKQYLASRAGAQAESLPSPPELYWETGRIEPGQRYFFIKRKNEIGWLFEMAETGWVVVRCEKIAERETFIRRYEAWDIVTLYSRVVGDKNYRIASQQSNGELLSLLLYQRLAFQEVVQEDLQDWFA